MKIEYLKKVLGKVENRIEGLVDCLTESQRTIEGEDLITNDELFHLISEVMLSQQTTLLGLSALLRHEIDRGLPTLT